MKIHQLTGKLTTNAKRVGRGIAAGQGKTAGRGTKGQNARTGGGVRPGFEGGQNPLMHRIPKRRGFKSLGSKAQIIHTDQLNQFSGAVGVDQLAAAGLITDSNRAVKLLARGELTSKLQLTDIEASGGARKAVEAAGGKITNDQAVRPVKDRR